MSEWQLAIIRNVHGLSNPNRRPSPDKVEITPCIPPVMEGFSVMQRREKGCDIDNAKFYKTREGTILCEHEILTD
jgi:hypothetical protein